MLKPLGYNVIVKLDDTTQTESGIEVISDSTDLFGVVKACGDCVTLVKEGDRVMLSPYDYFEHEVDGEMLSFTIEKDIIAIVQKPHK